MRKVLLAVWAPGKPTPKWRSAQKRLVRECSWDQHPREEGKGQDWVEGEVGSDRVSIETEADPVGSFEDGMALQSLWGVRTRP